MYIVWLVMLFVVGACVGSFLCCQARRMHLKATNKNAKKLGKRSVCMQCKYQLRWYDNIPVLSWLRLRGKCRKCDCKIGAAELLAELGMGLACVALGTTMDIATAMPWDWVVFGAMMVLLMMLGELAIYDGLYGELPVLCLTMAAVCAIMILILKEWSLLSAAPFSMTENIWKPLGAVAILGGLYLVLYLVSKGKWVGDGDWILGAIMGATLMSPWLALVALCITNVLACVVTLPVIRKVHNKRIHLGPFMVAAWVITVALAGVLNSIIGG
ncbi:prepilin peptidase [Candidatus Saccharibacteria bacterium]|nr:prepilin peptidase [Candidatus Saccharibacteria bacterium]